MSLLLEALKRAEKAKDDAQRRAKGESTSDELQLERDAGAPEEGKHVMTRDELPELSSSLEIVSDDLSDRPPAAQPEPAIEPVAASRAASQRASGKRPAADDTASADRTAARKVFEAKKFREPNPKLPFYIVISLLGVFAIGTVVYFWYELRPPPSLVVTNPQRPPDEKPVEVAALKPAAPAAASAPAPAAAIPGLPGAAPVAGQAPPALPATPATPGAAPTVAPAPAPAAEPAKPAAPPAPRPVTTAPVAAVAAPAAAPTSPAAAPRTFTRAPARSAELTVRAPQARIHPGVTTGFAAYQSGNFDAARADYLAALKDEPDNRDALLGMAALELRAGKAAQSEDYYRRVLHADPRDAHALAGILALQAPLLDPVATESRVKSLLAANPDAHILHFTLGNQYAQQSRWAEAQQAYFRALAAAPENPDIAFNLAVSLDHLRQNALALRYYRSALVLAENRSASFDPEAIRARVKALER